MGVPRPKRHVREGTGTGGTGAESELAELIKDQELDLQGRAPASGAARLNDDLDDSARRLTDVIHRDLPRLGRRPKIRSGTKRLEFLVNGETGMVLHAATVLTAEGTTDLQGNALAEPTDWAEFAARVVVGAKLAALAYQDEIRDIPEDQRAGIPDPRGPSPTVGTSFEVSPVGLMVRRGHVVELYGRAEAAPAVMLAKMRSGKWGPPPAWLTEQLLAWLVQLASAGSGGGGQLSEKRLVKLLRRPPELGRYLQRRVGRSRDLRTIAASLPRK
jgi:hypothetical protein